ncbi:nucleoside deaminase [Citrobacter sp. ANG330]|uniref:nucleoside deaminase n=1 Tax=Citrobacter sp. ANG330 TaxID=3048142 RepID=UPI0039C253EE
MDDIIQLEYYMRHAIYEAEESLREGNKGFGAVIIKEGEIIAAAHDGEETESDPTSHAEINAIKLAGKKIGKDLSGCILLSTSEPCPMCAFAIAWSGIKEIAYGYSIQDALAQGRRRILFLCTEAFDKAGMDITVHKGVLQRECSILYRADVRHEINNLRAATDDDLRALNADSIARRTAWYSENGAILHTEQCTLLEAAHHLLVTRFHAAEEEMPVVAKSEKQITFHSMNFCPTLEACKILRLDTRHVCKLLNEDSTNRLVKNIDRRLRFSRNYASLRPYTPFCEEFISIED